MADEVKSQHRNAHAPSPARRVAPRKLRGRVAHTTRGRVRLQFRGGTPGELQQIESAVRTLPEVREVEVRPATSSVIVKHTAEHERFAEALADLVTHSSLFYLEAADDPSQARAQFTDVEHDAAYLVDHSRAGKAIMRYAEHVNRAVKTATDGWLDLRVLVPAAMGVAALMFVEVESAPLWVPLALFSFQSFNTLHQPHPTTEGEAVRPMPLVPGADPAARDSAPTSQLTEIRQAKVATEPDTATPAAKRKPRRAQPAKAAKAQP